LLQRESSASPTSVQKSRLHGSHCSCPADAGSPVLVAPRGGGLDHGVPDGFRLCCLGPAAAGPGLLNLLGRWCPPGHLGWRACGGPSRQPGGQRLCSPPPPLARDHRLLLQLVRRRGLGAVRRTRRSAASVRSGGGHRRDAAATDLRHVQRACRRQDPQPIDERLLVMGSMSPCASTQ